MSKVSIALRVNDEPTEVSFAPHKTLLEVLREDLALTGTKHGCELGECGACAVLVDGKAILSCLSLGVEAAGKSVDTIEGMADGPELHPLQQAFADLGATQCGYCTPGILLTAKALLAEKASPTRAEIKEALAGNLCRCTGYLQIFEAVEAAILKIAETPSKTEIAAATNERVNTLNVRLLRARRKLREQVERTCRACATHGCLDCDCA